MGKVMKLCWALCTLLVATATLTEVRAEGARVDIGASLVVIVSQRSTTRSLSFSTVRDIFLGVPVFARAGEPYVPVTQPARTPVRTAFDLQFLGLDPDAVGRYWIDQRIRARATPPRTIPSVDTLRRVVAALPQAISYVRADELQPGIVPVKIDGIDFRSPEYRYRMSLVSGSGSAGVSPKVRF